MLSRFSRTFKPTSHWLNSFACTLEAVTLKVVARNFPRGLSSDSSASQNIEQTFRLQFYQLSNVTRTAELIATPLLPPAIDSCLTFVYFTVTETRFGCVFPFTYKGKTYYECTTENHPARKKNTPWCSMTKEYKGFWMDCGNQWEYACVYLDHQTGKFWPIQLWCGNLDGVFG